MSDQAFELKASLFTLTILQLKTFDVDLITQQLAATIQKAPSFFQNAPVVFDLHRLQAIQCPIDFDALIKTLKAHQLIPVAIVGANADQSKQAAAAGIGSLPGQYTAKKPEESEATAEPAAVAQIETISQADPVTKIVSQPVRSGQQIYAKDGDLIVLASVSHGAELIADGNIHVYGTLRGRALAGASGDAKARIFCHKFEAELVSIAGLYQLNDQYKTKLGQAHCQVFRDTDKLCIEQMV